MEQSVWTSLPMARAIEHMLPNSPFAANAAVAKPSKKTPATAHLRYVLTIVSSPQGVGGGPIQLYPLGVRICVTLVTLIDVPRLSNAPVGPSERLCRKPGGGCDLSHE